MAEPKNNDSELEKKLWQTADKLRSNMDAAEYKHVVLGLIFLKYISDSFLEKYEELRNAYALHYNNDLTVRFVLPNFFLTETVAGATNEKREGVVKFIRVVKNDVVL